MSGVDATQPCELGPQPLPIDDAQYLQFVPLTVPAGRRGQRPVVDRSFGILARLTDYRPNLTDYRPNLFGTNAPGATFAVRYDPENPDVATVEPGGLATVATYLLVGIGFLVGGWMIV